jgi:hypothetical protein
MGYVQQGEILTPVVGRNLRLIMVSLWEHDLWCGCSWHSFSSQSPALQIADDLDDFPPRPSYAIHFSPVDRRSCRPFQEKRGALVEGGRGWASVHHTPAG